MKPLILLITLTISTLCFAAADFTKQLAQIQAGQVTKTQLNQWRNELLYPYLLEQWLTENLKNIEVNTAQTFLNNPNYEAAAVRFRPKWHQEIIRRQDWQAIHDTFKTHKNAVHSCHFLEAQLALGKAIDFTKISTLWDSEKSQPDHCDPFFTLWLASLNNPDDAIWARQQKAFYARSGSLVSYLNSLYQTDRYRALGEQLTKVYNAPKQLVEYRYNPDDADSRAIALAAVNRMSFQDPRSASNLWSQVVKHSPKLTVEQRQQASRYLGIAMAKNALPQADYWLTLADPKLADKTIQHWRLQIALLNNDYSTVEQRHASLSPDVKNDIQFQYWYGFARFKNTGQIERDNPLIQLSKQRRYYGYLAAGLLGVTPSLAANPSYAPVDTKAIESAVEIQRAKALYEQGYIKRASLEWHRYIRNLSNPLQHAAAEVAYQWGWHAKSSQAAGWSQRYDLIPLRYPAAFEETVNQYANEFALPKRWIYGVMRQESRFDEHAISPANAHGLMQILPTTAQETADRFNLTYSGKNDLYKPQINIAIGSQYLRELLDTFGHPVYATAAYNAGPSRVTRWQNQFPTDMPRWIESIPFDETRHYVKSVMAYSQIYALTFNSEWRLKEWIEPDGS